MYAFIVFILVLPAFLWACNPKSFKKHKISSKGLTNEALARALSKKFSVNVPRIDYTRKIANTGGTYIWGLKTLYINQDVAPFIYGGELGATAHEWAHFFQDITGKDWPIEVSKSEKELYAKIAASQGQPESYEAFAYYCQHNWQKIIGG